jgi:excisionase family DNA binding protein
MQPFVPIEDVARHFSVSVSTIRAWVRQGHIPKDTYVKIGNTYRFNVRDVSDALTHNNKESDQPVIDFDDDEDI